MISYQAFFILIISLLLIVGCDNGEGELPPNPFNVEEIDLGDTLVSDTVVPLTSTLNSLHSRVFKPTCANSGCHDGHFSPDFRTISGTYATLLWVSPVKPSPSGSYSYLVEPGQPDKSMLMHRLLKDIDGQSGIMPLAVDPDSDWDSLKLDYLYQIREWIRKGAADPTGNSSVSIGSDLPPFQEGFAIALGTTGEFLQRKRGNGPLQLASAPASLKFWVSLSDDQTPLNQLIEPTLYASAHATDYSQAKRYPLTWTSSPEFEPGYLGDEVAYKFYVEIPLANLPASSPLFFRIAVQDPALGVVSEIPVPDSPPHLVTYFSLEK